MVIRDSNLIEGMFHFRSSFMDDLDEEKLTEKVKLSIQSAGFDKLDTSKKELDHTREKERGLDILQQILPNADLRTAKKEIKEFQAVARYDPTGNFSSQFEKKPDTMQEKKEQAQSGKKVKIEGKNLEISKGLDIRNLKVIKANHILKYSTEAFAVEEKKNGVKKKKKKVIKDVKKQKWADISKEKEALKEFKLFG